MKKSYFILLIIVMLNLKILINSNYNIDELNISLPDLINLEYFHFV